MFAITEKINLRDKNQNQMWSMQQEQRSRIQIGINKIIFVVI